jgi:hypothetical protein
MSRLGQPSARHAETARHLLPGSLTQGTMARPIALRCRNRFPFRSDVSMTTIRLGVLVLVVFAGSSPALAQGTDEGLVAPYVPALAADQAVSVSPVAGSSKMVLVPFGPYVTGVGTGCGGADVSEVGSGLVTLGWSVKSGADRVAVDFILGAGTWQITDVKWLSYQVGAATTGSILGINHNFWNSDPTGLLPGGEWQAGPANSMTSIVWTGAYRVKNGGPFDCQRAIMQTNSNTGWLPVLSGGTYWLDTQCNGALSNGPWSPVEVPSSGSANGLQSAGGGVFQLIVDGSGVTDVTPQDFLFQLEGQSMGVGQFCTSKPSSLPACVPTLFGTGTSVSKTSGSYTMMASPVPGGSGKPGILIWTKNGLLGTPLNTSFGFLCLSQFQRAGNFPVSPGGTNGACNGTYNWPFQSIVASTATIFVGDNLHVQGWYRDAGFPPPGNANFTNGVGPIAVTP